MRRGRPISRLGHISRHVLPDAEWIGRTGRPMSPRGRGDHIAMMRAYDRMTHDGEKELAMWFLSSRRNVVLAALGRIPDQYITSVAGWLRNMKYEDGRPGPIKGWEMLEELNRWRVEQREEAARRFEHEHAEG